MNEIEINEHNLEKFLLNIRDSDREELIHYFGDNYREIFINTILNSKDFTYFLSYKSIPSCIGGLFPDKYGFQVWLLCANKYDRKFLYKYIKNKLSLMISKNIFLYNYIYKSNFDAIGWLSKLGFKFLETNDSNLKFFYSIRRIN